MDAVAGFAGGRGPQTTQRGLQLVFEIGRKTDSPRERLGGNIALLAPWIWSSETQIRLLTPRTVG